MRKHVSCRGRREALQRCSFCLSGVKQLVVVPAQVSLGGITCRLSSWHMVHTYYTPSP